MAKFCSKCNSPMNDGDVKCGYCGATADNAPAQAPAKKNQQVDLAKLMKDPKVKKFAPVAIVAAVIAVIVIIVAIASNAGYKGAVNNYMKGTIKNNPDKFVKSLSATYFGEDFDEEDMAEFKEDFDEDIQEMYEELAEEYGDNVKIKYEIVGAYDLDEDTLDDMEDAYDDEDIDYGKELKGKRVVLFITIKGEKKETTTHTAMTLVKEEGKWKVYRGYFF